MRLGLISAFLLAVTPLAAQPLKVEDPWAPLSLVLGEWVAEGEGKPGEGTGGFSFHPDLGQNILVRNSRADYPATKDRPAFSHADLMIVYREPAGNRLRAIYFDNEGHVINYAVEPSKDGSTVQFLSDVLPSSPRYRLTYRKTGPDTVTLKFEIAPPGKPEAFSTYIEARARRK
jgi:hypothetical protein